MRDVILLLIVFGMLPYALFQPHIGLLLWSWLGYMNPHRLTWGFAYDFPFVQIVAIVTFFSLVISREPKRFPWSGLTIIWLIFIAWMTLTTLFALNPTDAWYEWNRMIKIQVMVLVTLLIMGSRERLNLLVWVIAMSIAFFGIKGGAFTLLTGGNFIVWGPYGSFIEGNNEIALAILMVIPLMRYLQITTENRWLKRGLVLAMILCALAVIGSYSRGAFLGIGAMLFFLWLKSKRKLIIAVPLVVVAIAAFSFMPDKYFERMGTIQTYDEDASAMGRINAWWFAYNIAKQNPLIGGGYNTFTPELFQKHAPIPDDFHDAHSIYFEVLGEHGFVGLALFLTMGILMLLTGNWIIRNARGHPELEWAEHLAAMLQVSFIGYAIGGAFLGLAYFDLPYQLMAIMVLTKMIVYKQLNPEQSVPVRRGQISKSMLPVSRESRVR